MRKSKTNKCKCCNSALGAVASHLIFDEAGKQQNIAFLLFDYLGKQVNESDGDQQAVCDSCLRQLIQCYEFKQKCVQANQEDSDDDDTIDEEAETNDIIEEESYGTENYLVKPTPTENEYEFDRYARIIEECVDDDEADDVAKTAVESEYELLNNLTEFVLAKDYDVVDEQQSPNAADVEYLDVEVEDDGDYAYGEVEESVEPESEVIELTEFALDSTSKTVKTIDTVEDLHRIKEKLKRGVPRHMIELNQQTMKSTAQSLDVEKIRTSDDLINILEADYQNENNNYSRRNRDDADVFKIPKIESCEEIEYLEEEDSQVCIDEYLKSIAYIDYVENYEDLGFYCKLCSENLTSHQHMMHHIAKLHRTKDMSVCIFDKSCPVFGDTQKLQNHIFSEHFDLLPSKVYLSCSTCENVFDSPVQFGKHLCEILPTAEDERNEFNCESCERKLTSRNRYLFHRQFHLKNARPKVCIICEVSFQEEERFYNHVMFSHEKVFEHFCEHCDRSYSSSSQLERHVRTHTMSRQPLACAKCEKVFDDKTALEEHICDKQSGDKNSVCQVCNKVYKRPSRLRKHMTSHESVVVSSVLTCENCCMVFGNDTIAYDHCHRQHDDDTELIGQRTLSIALCCEFCENAFYDHLKLVEHKQKHQNDGKPFKCEFCMAKYDTYSKLKTHRNTHASQLVKFPVQRNYMCDRLNCWKKYRHWSDLLNHRKTVHLINPSIFKCTDCEKTFYQSWKFDYHKKTSHGESYTCNECNTLFNSIIRYKNHLKKRHTITAHPIVAKQIRKRQRTKDRPTTDIEKYLRNENDQIFCTECDKMMTTRNTARTHIEMVHLKIKNYACEICHKEFYLKKDLNDHTRIHTAETPFPCTSCEKQFRTSSMLNEHRKLHTNERRYKCPYCVAAFKRAYVLKNHIKQHIGVKEFVCPIENCDKEYRTQWELNFHCRKKHSPDTPKKFACCYNDCGVEFATNNDLTEHYELIHATDKTTKRKPKLKRAAPATSGKKGATGTKIIYVLPGPVQKTNNEDEETEAEHNYPAKKRQFDTEASCAPKFVYILEPPVGDSETEKVDDPSAMDLGACQDIDDESRAIIM